MPLISNNKFNMYDSLVTSINEADEIIMNVSFIRDSGLRLLIPELNKARTAGKSIKILTSDYMNVTEPSALYRLLDFPDVKIFENPKNISFHPKTYIFKNSKGVEIYVGSSNISYSALVSGVEWNYHFINDKNSDDVKEIIAEFDELYEHSSFNLSLEWLRNYEKSYTKSDIEKLIDPICDESKKLEPIKFQIPALYELSKTREEGYDKAMVVVGTGLGKTFLSIFDSMSFKKVLFVAHRDEILKDAKKSFEMVHENEASYGFVNGYSKDFDSDITFASISTLSKDTYLNDKIFKKDHFDYIVVDEFHHSAAPSYTKVLEYFEPEFMLGLTATPDRGDNGDVYKLCDYNVAYECDFRVGINNGWLAPFEYFGIYDDTDYSLIPWRNGKYDFESLENSLIVEARTKLILTKYIEHKKNHAIGFCASVKHCKVMQKYFEKAKIKSRIIIGETSIEQRQEIIQDFKDGKIEIIFTVDVFNEGIDIPCIDMVLFLRPTNSHTIFIQQLGRGLRTYEGKNHLRVLDFVGNYKGAELRPMFLTGVNPNSRKSLLSPIDADFILPSGCSAKFDFKIIEFFEEIRKRIDRLEDRIFEDYNRIKISLGYKPSLMDIYTFGEIPVHSYIQKYGSWFNFLEKNNELDEMQVMYSFLAKDFLSFLEKTAMTKSYKIPLLKSVVGKTLKEKSSLEEIGENFRLFYNNKVHGKDLNNKKHIDWSSWTHKDFMKLAKDNPIKFLTQGEKHINFFVYENNEFILNKNLYFEIKNNHMLALDIQNTLKYRNTNYFRRKYMEKE